MPIVIILIFAFSFFIFTIKFPLHSLIVVVFSYVVFPTSISISLFPGTGFPLLSVSRIFFLLFICGMLFNRKEPKNEKNFTPKYLIPLILFLLYSFIRSFWGFDQELNFKVFFSERYIGGIIIYFFAKKVIKDIPSFMKLSKVLYIAIILVSMIGIYEVFSGERFNNLGWVKSSSGLDETNYELTVGGKDFSERGGINRIESTYEHSISFGLALTFLLPFILIARKIKMDRISNITLIFLVIASIFTISRTAWFSIGINFLSFLRRNKIVALVLLALLFFIGVPFLTKAFITSNYADPSAFSFFSRIELMILYLGNISPISLILGYGLGTFSSIQIAGQITGIGLIPSDNSLAYMIFTSGIVGVMLFIVFMYYCLIYHFTFYKKLTNDDFAKPWAKAVLLGISIQFAIFLISNSMFQYPRLSFLFFAVLGASDGWIVRRTDVKT